jgi:acetyl-CoA/propionyl-CoA carboxylase, biotin carboxylase, biotin carboxyl carrier protein
MFETVLIANRGEIAVRIIRTLRRLGVKSVAVYSDADRGARHVLEADEALYLGPTSPSESYLNIERILNACDVSHAQAVHPGYGFLSENAHFAEACALNGVVFVGPSPRALTLMGDKIQAKLRVASAGVPVVPGRVALAMTDGDLAIAADEIGYPVLVKPSAGGGGKGMQLVERAESLRDALSSARREALSSFGDDTLFLERFVEQPRHIEVQVLADNFGTFVDLGERECTLQRRHQKVVEESPSPLIDDNTRRRLGDAALATARSVDYTGVGTVEFIVSSRLPDEFFFMEMNTRLQVEHPVTELVTGLDLVEQQLLVASGERLTSDVTNVKATGHAVEARIYAESPQRGFLPTVGRVLALREPTLEGVRVDSSLRDDLVVSSEYDPLLAKIIAWGPDRARAFERLHDALRESVIFGVETNASFLARLVVDRDVLSGHMDTGLIERELSRLVAAAPSFEALVLYAVAQLERETDSADPWDSADGWRLGGSHHSLSFDVAQRGGPTLVMTLSKHDELVVASMDGVDEIPVSLMVSDNDCWLDVGAERHRAWFAFDGATTWVCVNGETWAMKEEVVRRSRAAAASSNDIRSPMPGTVLAVRVGQGDVVTSGQALVIVSAMKMEHVLVAPQAGTVDILVREGDAVVVDEIVARLIPVEVVDDDE